MKTAGAFKYQIIKRIPAVLFAACACFTAFSQSPEYVVDRKFFFTEEKPVAMRLVSDFKKLINHKNKRNYARYVLPASVSMTFPDSTTVSATAEIRARGDFRREECYIPPIKVNFKVGDSPLRKLGNLKLVWPCDNISYNEQLVLKEYLVYKMYNLLTEKSFRVRLAKIDYADTNGKIRSRAHYGFFIEDVDDMARRNACVELDSFKLHTEQTNRDQMTLLAIFQFMIGNTDWAVSTYHNIKLIQDKDDRYSLPYAVPYDFDCNGMVNPDYGIPAPEFDIVTLRQRCYRGYARKAAELQAVLALFREKRQGFDSLVRNLTPLSQSNREEMTDYLAEFFKIIDNEQEVIRLFIANTRMN